MTFQSLSIGDRFEFDHVHLGSCHALAHGPWIKVSARCYSRTGDNARYQVGSVSLSVRTDKGSSPSCGGW
jgi:hypothetical protein